MKYLTCLKVKKKGNLNVQPKCIHFFTHLIKGQDKRTKSSVLFLLHFLNNSLCVQITFSVWYPDLLGFTNQFSISNSMCFLLFSLVSVPSLSLPRRSLCMNGQLAELHAVEYIYVQQPNGNTQVIIMWNIPGLKKFCLVNPHNPH